MKAIEQAGASSLLISSQSQKEIEWMAPRIGAGLFIAILLALVFSMKKK